MTKGGTFKMHISRLIMYFPSIFHDQEKIPLDYCVIRIFF